MNTTRATIIETADTLFYERGFGHTSFSDIADAVGISRGNFYYHFKSKDEILDAVIAARTRKTHEMLAKWESQSDGPAACIRCYLRIVLTNRGKIMHHGCPVGSLSGELAKLEHPSRPYANAIFLVFRDWLGRQFKAMGHRKDADALAMHVLAFSQGIAVMDNAFHDKIFVQREVERMTQWLADIATTSTTT